MEEHTEGDTRLFIRGSKSGKSTPLKALLIKVRSTRACPRRLLIDCFAFHRFSIDFPLTFPMIFHPCFSIHFPLIFTAFPLRFALHGQQVREIDAAEGALDHGAAGLELVYGGLPAFDRLLRALMVRFRSTLSTGLIWRYCCAVQRFKF